MARNLFLTHNGHIIETLSFSSHHLSFTIERLVPGHLHIAWFLPHPLRTNETSNMFLRRVSQLDKEHVGEWIRDGKRKKGGSLFKIFIFQPVPQGTSQFYKKPSLQLKHQPSFASSFSGCCSSFNCKSWHTISLGSENTLINTTPCGSILITPCLKMAVYQFCII